MGNCCIFVTVFHRILDFKNGAGFLSGPLFYLIFNIGGLKIAKSVWICIYLSVAGKFNHPHLGLVSVVKWAENNSG